MKAKDINWKYFTLAEFTKSDTASRKGISNTPNEAAISALNELVTNILDPLREMYRKPIKVNSGYRSSALNRAVGGSSTSQHLKGEAADIDTGSRDGNRLLFDLIQHNFEYDQLINEKPDKEGRPSWVHISYVRHNRKQILTIR